MLRLRNKMINRVNSAGEKEAGQGTLEYLGIVIVAAILVGAVIMAINSFDLQGKVETELEKVGEEG